MKTIRNLLPFIAILAMAQLTLAAVPSGINYQGRLTNASGVPQPGTKTMSLKICDAATAGTQLYAESIGSVTVDANGVYSFQFGANGISAALVAGGEQWLELTINGVPQSPRQKLLAVPFAIRAANADQAATATTVVDGSITSAKLSASAVTDSLGNGGNIIAAKQVRNDLIAQGFLEVGLTDCSTLTVGKSSTSTLTNNLSFDDTVVWTGTELIAFGGTRSGLNIGECYNPITNTWRNTAAPPTARQYHTAIWSGTEMLVWGGNVDPSTGLQTNTGARYNPSTNTWTTISTTNAPSARGSHTAVWTGTEMLIWGGVGSDGLALNTGKCYNPTTNTWTTISTTNAPTARADHTAVWTGTEMLVWGGWDGTGFSTNTGARYNRSTNTWVAISTTNAPPARALHTAFWAGTEMIIWGDSYSRPLTTTGSRYNPSSNTWVAMTSGSISNQGAWNGSEFLAWQQDPYTPSGASYDFAKNSWSRFLLNSSQSSPDPIIYSFTPGTKMIWLGDRLAFYTGGNIILVRPSLIRLYAKP